jgi:signal transduction histidine kinase
LLAVASDEKNDFTPDKIGTYPTIAQLLGVACADRRANHSLNERVKELTCMYEMAQLSVNPGLSLEQLLEKTVNLIPVAWQYPQNAQARIIFDDKVYRTSGYINVEPRMVKTFEIFGKERGLIEVVYVNFKPELDDEIFLKEEYNLLDSLARQLGITIERRLTQLERVRLQEQLRHADRLATIGQLASGVAHELNEPLAGILGFSQLIGDSAELPLQIKDDIDKIIKSALHAREIVRKLLFFARQMPTKKQTTNINKIIDSGLYFLESRCKKEGINLIRDLKPLPDIDADESQMHQVM